MKARNDHLQNYHLLLTHFTKHRKNNHQLSFEIQLLIIVVLYQPNPVLISILPIILVAVGGSTASLYF
jgi:hypothetical protein